jgi:predicted AlkP superfamily phosphohydrolase/phosphomutase
VEEKPAPLLIVALDAGDPDRILEWASEGKLPVVASMLERGVAAGVLGPESVSVHGIWATFFTGLSLAEHGRYARRSLRPGTYKLEKAPLDRAAIRPFWAQLEEPAPEVLVVDAPDIPLISGLKGRQLARWGEHLASGPEAEPAGLAEHVLRLAGPPIRTNEGQRGGRWRDRRVLPQILERIERKGHLCRELLAERPADIVVVGFGDTHAVGHRFGRYETEGDPLAEAVLRVYRSLDSELGRLIEQFETPPNVFVVADSGIREGQPLGTVMDELCRALGYKALRDPSRADPVGTRIRTALTPLLSSRSRTALREEKFLGNIDWSRTSVFVIPSTYTGYLRVNLAGREPEGIVSPGTDYGELLGRLTSDLELLKDAATGDPVVASITRTTEVFGGDPPLRLPDLFVEFRPCSLPQRIVHPRATVWRQRGGDRRDNSHTRRGLVLAAGPDIAQHGVVGDLAPREVTPLFRTALGESADTAPNLGGVEEFFA